jgi:HPt (histidine-containing phosphotransfer) domain-containing protein
MPLFDEKELLDRVDHDIDFLADTVRMLETDGRALLDEISLAAATGDAPTLGRSAHTLKGMISNFCAPEFHASATQVEKIGKEGDLAPAPAAVAALEAQLDALIKALNDFLATAATKP